MQRTQTPPYRIERITAPMPSLAQGPPGAAAPDTAAETERHQMALARRDPAAFAPIYEQYFPRIYGYCLRRVSTPQEAEDLTSQVFTRALAGLDGYRGGSVAAWLFRIAHNAVLNQRRARRPAISLDESVFEVADDAPAPFEIVAQREAQAAVRALVQDLPDDQQNLLALKLVAGLSSPEIGAVLGKSPGAVRVELHRIIRALRAAFEAAHGHPEGGAS